MNFLWSKLLRQRPGGVVATESTSTARQKAVAGSAEISISLDAVVRAELMGVAMAVALSAAVVG